MTPLTLASPNSSAVDFCRSSYGDHDDDDENPPYPSVLLCFSPSRLFLSHKSVCYAISTPEIIAVVTNAAGRRRWGRERRGGGGVMEVWVIVMSSPSICGVNSDSAAFQCKSGAADPVASDTM